ncbi:MAG: single-stranded DNA-binding protein [Lachnospiraceae bacterium]|nr:single-stranded DNA-binding protein [Lachnospiraceae bacterium]
MNTVILMGRLTRDPEVRYSNGDSSMAIARYRLAVDRRFKREGQPDADFFDCVVFGRQAEFAEKYLHQGTKLVVQGRLQNDNYTDKDGRMVYRNQIVVENQEFAESKAASQQNGTYRAPSDNQGSYGRQQSRMSAPVDTSADGFMNIPDGIDEELPFT